MKAVYLVSSRMSLSIANTSGLHLINSPSRSKLVCAELGSRVALHVILRLTAFLGYASSCGTRGVERHIRLHARGSCESVDSASFQFCQRGLGWTQDERRDDMHLEIAGALGIEDAVNQVQQEARACHQHLRAHVGAAQECLHTRR